MDLSGKTILITGSAVRVGRAMALKIAEHGGKVVIHYRSSDNEAKELQAEIQSLGAQAYLVQGDLNKLESVADIVTQAGEFGPLFGLVNNASIFEDLPLADTTLDVWQRHMNINLSAPYLLSQAFAEQVPQNQPGRIVNLLDWRALRPGADHFAYTISKAGLAALTRSLAIALAPNITVNGMALGAVLPPSDGGETDDILKNVPAKRWADLEEVSNTLIYLLSGPAYVTGEIIHVDGGRHLI